MPRQYFIFVATDVDRNLLRFPSGFEVARFCMRKGIWGFGDRFHFVHDIAKGDRVLIYVAGRREYSQSFAGHATVAEKCSRVPLDISGKKWPQSIRLKSCRLFEEVLPIRPLLEELTFIKKSSSGRWGSIFQGGVVRLTEKDFSSILNAALRMHSRSPLK